ncbi:MAG: hydroxymethylglutaryl-CoA reductase [Flavobacteriales bacterium]|nr:hydroxymethylglutaryl-CoA reductase [Bacteroidota bacterium]MCB9239958.1 hydroxymethylglutaryl-CoA reductase [Flavobacteriales bacterium]
MTSTNPIKGFSKLTKEAKTEWLISNYFEEPDRALQLLKSYWHTDQNIQKLHDEFIENTLTNFYLPFGVAPNFLLNDTLYCLPMAIEESSVVAAMAKAANFWLDKGGFKSEVVSTKKVGHVHFVWRGDDATHLHRFFQSIRDRFFTDTEKITANMRARGGGILDIELIDKTSLEPNYYQIKGTFETCDSMGANFINTILESWASILRDEVLLTQHLNDADREIEVIMCILSNYTPECLVRSEVSCSVDRLVEGSDMSAREFAEKFERAIHVAEIEPYRAVTHNKGIMNGIDSVVIATGNDFRATEACAHAYAARNGRYSSLTHCELVGNDFRFYIEVPLALGTVGGITSLHPMVKFASELLGRPNATELMQIIASAGLAQNFSALRSLTTTGIQKGHMKMHLLNILNQLEATEAEKAMIVNYFKSDVPHYNTVVEVFKRVRGGEVLS